MWRVVIEKGVLKSWVAETWIELGSNFTNTSIEIIFRYYNFLLKRFKIFLVAATDSVWKHYVKFDTFLLIFQIFHFRIPQFIVFLHCLLSCPTIVALTGLTLTARGSTSVCRRQILTTKVDPRTVRVKIFLMVVYPYHRYSNESERAN